MIEGWEYCVANWRADLSEMNRLGANGWELVFMTHAPVNPTVLVFKRRLSAEAAAAIRSQS